MSTQKNGTSIKLSLKLTSSGVKAEAGTESGRSTANSGTPVQKKRKLGASKTGPESSGTETIPLLPGTLIFTTTKLLQSLKTLVIGGRSISDPFIELPDKSIYPDYYKIIKEPVALNTIEASISSYKNLSEFQSDIDRLVQNCITYNAEGSDICDDVRALAAHFKSELQKIRTSHSTALGVSDEFFDAIEKGNLKTFTRLYTVFPTMNFLHSVHMFNTTFLWSPMHACAYYGQQRMLEMLAESDADVEFEDTLYKGRPLAWAAFGGQYKVCKYLIEERKANPKAKNIHNQTAADLVSDPNNPTWKSILFPDTNAPSMTVKLTVKDLPPPADKSKKSIKEQKIRPAKESAPSSAAPTTHQPVSQQTLSHQPPAKSSADNLKVEAPKVAASETDAVRLDVSRLLNAIKRTDGASSKLSSVANSPSVSVASAGALETSSSSSALLPSTTSSVGGGTSHQPIATISQLPPLSELKEAYRPAVDGLLTSIGIVANDDAFKMVIPYSPDDPEQGFAGHAITVSSVVKSINFRLMLNVSPFELPEKMIGTLRPNIRFQCSGFHTYHATTALPQPKVNPPPRVPLPPTIVSQQCFEPLQFKNAIPGAGPAGDIQDCSAMIYDGLNAFEIVVSAYLWLRDGNKVVVIHEIHQTIGLMIHRMSR